MSETNPFSDLDNSEKSLVPQFLREVLKRRELKRRVQADGFEIARQLSEFLTPRLGVSRRPINIESLQNRFNLLNLELQNTPELTIKYQPDPTREPNFLVAGDGVIQQFYLDREGYVYKIVTTIQTPPEDSRYRKLKQRFQYSPRDEGLKKPVEISITDSLEKERSSENTVITLGQSGKKPSYPAIRRVWYDSHNQLLETPNQVSYLYFDRLTQQAYADLQDAILSPGRLQDSLLSDDKYSDLFFSSDENDPFIEAKRQQ